VGKRQFGSIRKLPSGRWQARYRTASGAVVSAPKTFTTKGDAGRWLAAAETDILRGVFVDPRAGRMTVEAWATEWLGGDPRKRRSSRARDRSTLDRWVLPAIGPARLGDISRVEIRRLIDAMTAALAPATVHRNMGTVAALFNAAVDADLIGRSPVRGAHLPAIEETARPLLSIEQIGQLADAIEDRYRALVLIGVVIGLRWGEAVGLRLIDVDFVHGRLTVHQAVSEVGGRLAIEQPKTARSRRTVAIPQFLLDQIAEHIRRFRPDAAGDDLLFLGPQGGVLRRNFKSRKLDRAIAAAGLDPRVTFHGLRHIADALMVANGEHAVTMAARMGHSNPRLSVGLYGHAPEDVDKAAAERLGQLFAAAPAEPTQTESDDDGPDGQLRFGFGVSAMDVAERSAPSIVALGRLLRRRDWLRGPWSNSG
jgi:integrase